MGNSTGKPMPWQQIVPTDYSELEEKIKDQCETLNCLPLGFLIAITGNFSMGRELGRDPFGVVYKVCLDISLCFSLLHFLCLNSLDYKQATIYRVF